VALTAIFDVDLYYVEQVRNNEYVYSNMKKLFFAAKDGCAVAAEKNFRLAIEAMLERLMKVRSYDCQWLTVGG
jgi:hypothetical protein